MNRYSLYKLLVTFILMIKILIENIYTVKSRGRRYTFHIT
jgi:hypothetical protein